MEGVRLMASGEASRLLGVSPTWLRELGQRGQLKVWRAGKLFLFDAAEVQCLAVRRRCPEVGLGDAPVVVAS